MDLGTFRAIVTAVLLVAFCALVGWAWSSRRRTEFEEAARLPLEDVDPPRSNQGEENE